VTGAMTAFAIAVGGVSLIGGAVAPSPPRGRPIFVMAQAIPMRAATISAPIIRAVRATQVMGEDAVTAGWKRSI
jgi:hypothetical protein